MAAEAKNNDCLSERLILAIARAIAIKYDLKAPNPLEFHRQSGVRTPLPIVTDNGNGMLWVDKYYVAYQLDGSRVVKYVYLTKHHVFEEMSSYRAAAKERGNSVKIPGYIVRQFRNAILDMNAVGVEMWVDQDEKLPL